MFAVTLGTRVGLWRSGCGRHRPLVCPEGKSPQSCVALPGVRLVTGGWEPVDWQLGRQWPSKAQRPGGSWSRWHQEEASDFRATERSAGRVLCVEESAGCEARVPCLHSPSEGPRAQLGTPPSLVPVGQSSVLLFGQLSSCRLEDFSFERSGDAGGPQWEFTFLILGSLV